mmetsp:Transcript_17067/g.42359  ORF Transcript_17067/g.42359 Transcript_17067/m.42359 type:complete len:317 (+) Transcript_17067:285-1235(+)
MAHAPLVSSRERDSSTCHKIARVTCHASSKPRHSRLSVEVAKVDAKVAVVAHEVGREERPRVDEEAEPLRDDLDPEALHVDVLHLARGQADHLGGQAAPVGEQHRHVERAHGHHHVVVPVRRRLDGLLLARAVRALVERRRELGGAALRAADERLRAGHGRGGAEGGARHRYGREEHRDEDVQPAAARHRVALALGVGGEGGVAEEGAVGGDPGGGEQGAVRRDLGARERREAEAEEQRQRDERLLRRARRAAEDDEQEDPAAQARRVESRRSEHDGQPPAAAALVVRGLVVCEPGLVHGVAEVDDQQELHHKEPE